MEASLGPGRVIDAPLTEAQEGLWLARRLDPRNPSQNTGQILRLRGPLDPDLLRAVLDRTLSECDAFALRIDPGRSEPRLTSVGVAPIPVELVDLSGEGDPRRAARARIHADMERARDPTRDPMVTVAVYRVDAEEHWWYLCAQHLVIDAYGTTLLNVRVLDLLGARLADRAPRTRPFASFRGVVEEDRVYRSSPERAADLAFWREALADLRGVRSLKEGEPLASRFHQRARMELPLELQEGLQRLARGVRAPWPDAVTAAVAAYVRRHTRTEDVVLGVPVMNRLGSAAVRVPCTLMNVMPMRVRVDEDEGPPAAAARVSASLKEARAHGRFRGEELRRAFGFLGGGRRLFGPQVNVLPFQPLPRPEGIEPDLEVLGAGPVDDLTITFRGGGVGSALALEVDSNPALYSLDETEAHRDRLVAFLTAFCETSGPVSAVPTLTPGERRRWLRDVNATEHAVEETTLVELIERACAARPDGVALASGDERVTYRDLGERVRALADRLCAHGVAPGAVVGVLLPRSIDQVVAFVAAMRAGAAYLPLDPEHPEARTRQLIAAAQPAVVLTPPELRSRAEAPGVTALAWPSDGPGGASEPAAAGTPVADAPAASSAPAAPPPRDAASAPGPRDPAYVIYTSGSTGEPKGVVIEQRAIVNRLAWMRETFAFGPEDRILYKTPATFDVSVWELFLPLITGATLVVAPPGAQRDPGWLAALIREHAITAVHFVPSMLGPFLEHPASRGLEVARVICSGEALTAALRGRFHERVRGELHNLYGPTEAAVDVTHWPAPAHDRSDPVPIGRPVWNTRMYVLDERLSPLPPGVPGELYIGGRQLARGYLGRPDLTARSFLPDPHVPGARMYRTGDLAAWREDGALEFGGRMDHQVKVRGQRVELGEVEGALLSQPNVENAVAALRGDGPAGPALVGYVVPSSGATIEAEETRAGVARRLPDVMVPGVIVPLDALPLTSSGKVDRAALPAPPRAQVRDRGELRSETERVVARLFRDVLGLAATPGPSDDFFALGGQSLHAIEVLAGIRDARGIEVGPGAIFSRPTVTRLAAFIDELSPAAETPAAALNETQGLEPLLLLAAGGASGAEAPLYCIHPAGGISWCYLELARSLTPPRRVVGVQAPGLGSARATPPSLDALASLYVDRVLEAHEGGPVHLLGWSVGGIIAHAMALRLLEIGHQPGIIALLDAYPADCWRDMHEVEQGDVLKALLLIAGEDPIDIDAPTLTREIVRARLVARGHVLGALSDAALDGVVRVVEANNRFVRGHRHRRLEGDLLHFRAGLDHAGTDLDAALWHPYARHVEAHVVPTVHAHMTGAAAAARIATVLERKLSSGPQRGGG